MTWAVPSQSLHELAAAQASALLEEFGAGATLLAQGQLSAAQDACALNAAAFWAAVLTGVARYVSGDHGKAMTAAAPDRISNCPRQDDTAAGRLSQTRDAIAMYAELAAAERGRIAVGH